MARKMNLNNQTMSWFAFPKTEDSIEMILVDNYQVDVFEQINDATAMGHFDELKLSDGPIFSVAETAGCNNDDCTDLYDVTTTANVASSRVSHEPMPFLCMTLLTLTYISVSEMETN